MYIYKTTNTKERVTQTKIHKIDCRLSMFMFILSDTWSQDRSQGTRHCASHTWVTEGEEEEKKKNVFFMREKVIVGIFSICAVALDHQSMSSRTNNTCVPIQLASQAPIFHIARILQTAIKFAMKKEDNYRVENMEISTFITIPVERIF